MVVELRAKELVYATIFFAAVVILVFCFAFLGGARPTVDVDAGVLWVAMALAGTVGISRAFEREREGDTMRALLLAPVPRAALYLSKLSAISVLMLVVEIVALFMVALLFGVGIGSVLPTLVALLLLGTIGFAAVAALFGASLGRARSRDVLLAAARLSDRRAGAHRRHARHGGPAHGRRAGGGCVLAQVHVGVRRRVRLARRLGLRTSRRR